MKKFLITKMYRGQQMNVSCWSTTVVKAAEKLGVKPYDIRTYGIRTSSGEPFEGVMGSFDSGMLWRVEELKHLIGVDIPIEELKLIFDKYIDIKNKK